MCVNYIEIGQRIRDIRKQRRYTQETLAEAADLSASYVSHIELGVKSASLAAILQIAKALDVSLDQLLYGKPVTAPVSAATPAPSSCSGLPEVQALLDDVSDQERKFIFETIYSIQKNLRSSGLVT